MPYRFILPNVFSCPFASTAIAEVDEKDLRAGARVPGMSSKKRFVFLLCFHKTMEYLRRMLVIPFFFSEKKSFFGKFKNKKVAWLTKKHIIIGKQKPLFWQNYYHGTVSANGQFPPNVVIGDDFSNIWYAILISSSLHYCKVRWSMIRDTAVTKQWIAKWPDFANAIFWIVKKHWE